ncbi:hypothetical protein SAMN06265221_101359 [Paracoccus laeviglucosivorans]|uniref:Uncharacterized protein n=1 Tax=Paracoccus laeviglucosivorans TaxID=1197861 RepID=A0A521ATY1_9RHOB|nr:hypothetical protein SAMN06265221_101359 [Paracoccus laeviglucosivorans]
MRRIEGGGICAALSIVLFPLYILAFFPVFGRFVNSPEWFARTMHLTLLAPVVFGLCGGLFGWLIPPKARAGGEAARFTSPRFFPSVRWRVGWLCTSHPMLQRC